MGVNERIKFATTFGEVALLAAQSQPTASAKTLRRRAKLVRQKAKELK
jgi:hypothetical protein